MAVELVPAQFWSTDLESHATAYTFRAQLSDICVTCALQTPQRHFEMHGRRSTMDAASNARRHPLMRPNSSAPYIAVYERKSRVRQRLLTRLLRLIVSCRLYFYCYMLFGSHAIYLCLASYAAHPLGGEGVTFTDEDRSRWSRKASHHRTPSPFNYR